MPIGMILKLNEGTLQTRLEVWARMIQRQFLPTKAPHCWWGILWTV